PDICSCLCRYVLDHSLPPSSSFLFSCIHSPPTEIYTLSLHALFRSRRPAVVHNPGAGGRGPLGDDQRFGEIVDGVLAHQVAGEDGEHGDDDQRQHQVKPVEGGPGLFRPLPPSLSRRLSLAPRHASTSVHGRLLPAYYGSHSCQSL